METWRATVPRSRWRPQINSASQRRRSGRPHRGICRRWPSDRGNNDRWRLGGLRSLVAVGGRKSTPYHGADGADALQGICRQWPSDRSNDDRWRLGGLRSLVAVGGRKSTALHSADGADALIGGSADDGHPIAATMIDGDLEGYGPS